MSTLILLLVIYASFISLGLPDSMLGTAWPLMHLDINASVNTAGIVSTLVSIGTVISSILYSKYLSRARTEVITLFSIVATALALLFFSFSGSLLGLLPVAIVLGIGAGAVDASLNNYVAIHYKSNVMGFLHAFWGIGTLISPFLFGYLFSIGISWREGYFSLSFVQLSIALIVLSSFPLWKKEEKRFKLEHREIETDDLGMKYTITELFKTKGVIPAVLSSFTYSAVEQTAMLWAPTFLVWANGMNESDAATAGGMIFLGITVGRILTGLLSEKAGSSRLISIGHVLILFGILSLIILPKEYIPIYFIVFGIGLGPIYPMMVHQTPEIFGLSRSSQVLGLEMALSYISVATMPNLFGYLARLTSFSTLPFFLIAFLFLNIVTIQLKKRASYA